MKKLRLLALLLVATVPFAACDDDDGTTTEPQTGSIAGTVVVEGSPLSGVTVAISGPESATATTDSNGEYQFQNVETGSYTIEIADGVPEDVTFESSAKDASVSGDQTATVDFSGDYIRTASISGQVTAQTEDGTANVEGITVTLSGTESGETTTDAEGRFAFEGLRAGSYEVSLDTEGLDIEFDQTSQQVEVSVGGSAEVNFTGLQPKAAQVYIQRITNMAGTRIDPDDVEDRIFVHLAVEPGTETVSRVAIELNDEEVASQDVNVTSASSEASASAPTTVELSVNTAAFDEQTLQVDYPNGEYDLTATLETAEGSTAEAAQSQVLTFDNEDVLTVQYVDGSGNTAVGSGVRWHGGASFALQGQALLYSEQVQIDQLGVTCTTTGQTANGGASLDIGAGAGAEMVVSGPPFEYSAALDDNWGAVEDDPAGSGHTCMVSSVIDPDGLELIDQFSPANIVDLEEFFVDFVAPDVAAPGTDPDVEIDGTDPDGTGQHFSAGDFELASLNELGVGGENVGWAADNDGDSEADVEPVSSVADLVELQADEYTLLVTLIEDALGNAHDLDADPVVGGDNESLGFGVDKGAPEVTDIFPAAGSVIVLNPDDDNADGGGNNDILFTAEDPDLADGNPGSGITPANVVAELADGTAVPVNDGAAPDYVIDAAAAPLGTDDSFEISATAPDNAIAANETETVWNVIIDGTDPTTNMKNPPSSSVTTSNSTQTFTIEGNASDANGLSEVAVRVREDVADDGCDLGDPLVNDTGAGTQENADDDEIDVTADASGFAVDVQLEHPGATTQNVCFFIEAADNALNNEGDAEANTSDQSTRTEITWN